MKIIIALLILLFIGAAFGEIQVPGVRFGNSRLSDTTGYMATNRNFKVNGVFLSTDSVYSTRVTAADLFLNTTGAGLYFSAYNSSIVEGINQLSYSANTHTFNTKTGTELVSIDSMNLINNGFTQLGSTAPSIKTKLIKFITSASTATVTSSAHGIADYHSIISWTCSIRDESGNYLVNPGSWFTTLGFYARMDSLNCSVTVPAGATDLTSDSCFFLITYRQ